jgi:hypothetical protein
LEFQSSEEKILVFQPETSGGGLPCLNLSFHGVSGYLEGSSSRAEFLDFYNQLGGRNFSQGSLDLNLGGKEVNLVLYFNLYLPLGAYIFILEHFVVALIPSKGFTCYSSRFAVLLYQVLYII